MLPIPENYAIYPSTVPANEPCAMTIVPKERAFLLPEGEQYDLKIISVDADESCYYSPTTHKNITATARAGILTFTYRFEEEQEHIVILSKGAKALGEFHVYSLQPDLWELVALKGDLHSHSFRSDGQRDPAALAGHYREQGYDFFALTDHNRAYPGLEIDEAYKDLDLDFPRIFGEEVHCPGSVIHIVHVGGKASVTDRYVNHREEYEKEIASYPANAPQNIPEQYRERYGKAMWATDKIHAAGGIAIFPHPFWLPGNARTHNVSYPFAKILLQSGMFDAYELVGAMTQPNCNLSVALWTELRSEGHKIIPVGSSDVHSIESGRDFPNKFTLCFAQDNNSDAICNAVRKGLCVAVEATDVEYDRHYRAYGDFRLVSYAQFLLKYYFPKLQRIAEGQGVAMRSYAMGEAPAAFVELHAEQVKAFRARFFGRMAPVLPSPEILAFEERARERHLQGPVTKGSVIDSATVSRQI